MGEPPKVARAIDRALAEPRGATQLKLVNAGLTALPDRIAQLTRLRSLDLSGNALTDLPDWLGDLPLEKLYLSHNPLRTVPSVVTRLSRLVELHLRCHGLEALPPDIGRLTKLSVLVVVSHALRPPLDVVGELTALEALSLCDMGVRALPPALGRLSRLRELWIEKSALTTLPDEVCRLPVLHTLKATLACLEQLPPAFVELPSLTTLDLSFNARLAELPAGFGRLPRLEELNLGGSHLIELPESFAELPRLSKLGFHTLSPRTRADAVLDTISRTASLRRLSFLGHAGPLRVTPRVFELPLEWLSICDWSATLPELEAEGATLRGLMLSRCGLSSLPASFDRLTGLESIALDGNAFRTVPEVLSRLPHLKTIALRGCPITDVPSWAVERGIQVVHGATG